MLQNPGDRIRATRFLVEGKGWKLKRAWNFVKRISVSKSVLAELARGLLVNDMAEAVMVSHYQAMLEDLS